MNKKNFFQYVSVFFSSLLFLLMSCKKEKNTTTETKILDSNYPTVSVAENQEITSPTTITINSQGKWKANEGELGIVELFDENNKKIATAIMGSEDGNWMKEGSAYFLADLDFFVDKEQKGELVFHNNVVSDEGGAKKESFRISVILKPGNADESLLNEDGMMYFASKTKSLTGRDQDFNYQIMKFKIDRDAKANGFIIYAPFGTDGSRANFTGTYDKKSNTLKGTETALAEGEMYSNQKEYTIAHNAIDLGYKDQNNKNVTLPKLTASAFEQIYSDFNRSNQMNSLNTKDRSRALKITPLNYVGYSATELKNLQFLELEINLDNNYNTKEYLVYITDKMMCGSGGCNLYVINNQAKVLSSTSVVKLPIYVENSMANQNGKPKWSNLYVYSNGSYRKLSSNNGKYNSNASTAPAIPIEAVEMHPEKYRIVLDYIY